LYIFWKSVFIPSCIDMLKHSIKSNMKIEDRRSSCVWKTAWFYRQLGRILRQIGIWQMSQSVSATMWRINLGIEDKNDRGTRYITGHLRVGGCTIYALSTRLLAKRSSGDSCGPRRYNVTITAAQMICQSKNNTCKVDIKGSSGICL